MSLTAQNLDSREHEVCGVKLPEAEHQKPGPWKPIKAKEFSCEGRYIGLILSGVVKLRHDDGEVKNDIKSLRRLEKVLNPPKPKAAAKPKSADDKGDDKAEEEPKP
jgi:hypothetical protein